jgi:hypothetical protein
MSGRLRARFAAARERHRERHRPTGFGFALADSIDYLDGATWDTLAAGHSLFLQRRYLSALEPKAGLGARPERLWLWARHRNPAMNLLVRNLLRAVPHGQAPDRNPFKRARAVGE